ncbi:sensor histidine kinase [Aquincola sp. S2]|uniref:histidine kinase n=1 Tax=Pseudaquabacterium terrae TaxID=2732868 RepID=A0ABX2EFG2_9BURK|nr:sensor histidine kinase [Aquabacterium terrae]NRF67364.1 sensor histidine kinase [Aquabacterium terrae]
MSAVLDGTGSASLLDRIDDLASFNRHVAHDLRGPLGAVAGCARLAEQALERGDQALAARLLNALAGRVEELTQLVVELLALAEASDAPLAPAPVDLTVIAQNAIEQVRLAFDVPAEQFRLHALPTVDGVPGLLQQVFVNLLGNAVKFTRHVPAPLIEVGFAAAGGHRALYVRDNGVGFDDQRAAGLFQPFSRLHGKEYAGHGIGLSLVKRVVERHGGGVWAAAHPSSPGATFHFTLAGLA